MPRHFATTRWSLILASAAEGVGVEQRRALSQLCQLYWYPAYAYVRKWGRDPEAAHDFTQQFFTDLIAGSKLANVEQGRGKFRSWLLTCLKNALISDFHAQRGQQSKTEWLDADQAEGRYARERSHQITPEDLYNRSWSRALLMSALERFGEECARDGKGEIFAKVKPFLVGPEAEDPSYAPVAAALGLQVGNLKVIVHRLRKRFGMMLRDTIADVVASPEQVDEEIEFLLSSLSVAHPGSD